MDAVPSTCYVSVDGTDFKINEPSPWSEKWYSHKFNGPGLRYEIAVSIQAGEISWINGPYPCGEYSDLKIFRSELIHALDPGEKVVADKGYRGEACFIQKNEGSEEEHRAKGVLMARHETLNRRFKVFKALGHVFRHDLTKHSFVFHAVATIVQLTLKHESPIFEL